MLSSLSLEDALAFLKGVMIGACSGLVIALAFLGLVLYWTEKWRD